MAYLEQLKETLQYLGVSDCKMQEGSLRCNVNLSVRPLGRDQLGARTEMKNLSSFKAIARAIGYEAKRQMERIQEGGRVSQETRRWDENKDASCTMRSKEDAQDYRYFPEPDLPPSSCRRTIWTGCGPGFPSWPRPSGSGIRPSTACPSITAG